MFFYFYTVILHLNVSLDCINTYFDQERISKECLGPAGVQINQNMIISVHGFFYCGVFLGVVVDFFPVEWNPNATVRSDILMVVCLQKVWKGPLPVSAEKRPRELEADSDKKGSSSRTHQSATSRMISQLNEDKSLPPGLKKMFPGTFK